MLLLAIIGIGLFAGWLAQVIVPTHGRVNYQEALAVGVIGSFVGGLVISLIFGDGISIRPSGILGSIGGAIIVQLIWRAVRRPTRAPAATHHGRVTPKSTSRKRR